MGKRKDLSEFDKGQIVMARPLDQSISDPKLQLLWGVPSLQCERNSEKEKADSRKVFDDLMRCVERNQTELLRMMKEKQRATERQDEEFIKDLEEEITELKRRDTALERLSHSEEHLHFLQIRVLLFLGARNTPRAGLTSGLNPEMR
ncbi:hypothetical protein QTP70_032272 [Hemibagrus guttatus]|uniref:TRIM8/14/16/25/29/45/65 coiled-coil region domain-containing protein n=1 Tax=Hemibagrus guttatus TaxID=175788 RepID=A0AAE0Q7R5_9TELE|nr:hypothetical protein QTP70_032272 [Hemibagrus guttatus]KAK3541581.1 hypothetical protein QTP86_032827 [Hemibagrus guttatus]